MSELLESVADEVAASPSLPLPGAVLRAARESHGLSLAEISQALKFGVRQLEALENDDYSTLKGATFIRGFVRSYARYLRVDEAPLLAALEPQAPVVVAEVRAVEHMNAEMPSSIQDGSKRVYWLAVLVLVLGAVAWFALQDRSAPSPAATAAAPAPVLTSAEQPATGEPATQAPRATGGGQATIQASVAPPSAVVASAAPNMPSASASTPPASVEVPPALNPAERQLTLSFGGVSWVEVRDATNRILYSGNSTPDSRQTLRGRPPFQLVIGNAQSVKLRYEDRNVDLQPYTRVDVARLTLDDNTK